MIGEWCSGKLLVATPAMQDPNFVRTIVLILDHDDDGALGLVLNRASDIRVDEILEGWGGVVTPPAVVFSGGPVEPSAVVGLGRAYETTPRDSWEPIVGRVRAVDPSADPALVAAEVEAVRLFAGYAGWAPGQLEAELAQDAWLILDTDGRDPFTTDPDGLWRQVFSRQEGELKFLATFPDDPSLN